MMPCWNRRRRAHPRGVIGCSDFKYPPWRAPLAPRPCANGPNSLSAQGFRCVPAHWSTLPPMCAPAYRLPLRIRCLNLESFEKVPPSMRHTAMSAQGFGGLFGPCLAFTAKLRARIPSLTPLSRLNNRLVRPHLTAFLYCEKQEFLAADIITTYGPVPGGDLRGAGSCP